MGLRNGGSGRPGYDTVLVIVKTLLIVLSPCSYKDIEIEIDRDTFASIYEPLVHFYKNRSFINSKIAQKIGKSFHRCQAQILYRK